ncbi:hypothetical protein [Haloglomus litoreum]|uniref:hypothetical protein n=1 Tax=Haloglomus litoreum TaxID=3034026 RepID=UPI0023E84911|nr:hypothetical protein [Haloglomus sp. DT116]
MDLQVDGLEELEERVETALDRVTALQVGTQVTSEAFFPPSFMRAHTTFDSFEAFCEQSPWAVDDIGDVQNTAQEPLDQYVADTTDFDSWEGMKVQAAEEDIIDEIVD